MKEKLKRLRVVPQALVEALGRSLTLKLLLGTWIAVAIFSGIALPPGDDDRFFLSGALGFGQTGYPSMMIADEFAPVFTTLPGPFVFHGIFWKVTGLLGIPLNLLTYKAFQVLTLLSVLLVGVSLLKALQPEPANQIRSAALFLVCIAVTPYAQFGWTLRPELLGILLVVLGLRAYGLWERDQNERSFWLSSIWFGLAITIHPNFSLRVAAVLVAVLVLEMGARRIGRAFCYGLVASTPFLLAMIWYGSQAPFSFEELSYLIGTKGDSVGLNGFPGLRLLSLSLLQRDADSLLVSLAYSLFWFPLSLLLGGAVWLFRRKWADIPKQKTLILLGVLAGFEVVRMVIPEGDSTMSYFNITSVMVALWVATLLVRGWTSPDSAPKEPGLAVQLAQAALLVIVCLHPLVHLGKHLVRPGQYFDARAIRSAVVADLQEEDHLFVVPGKLIIPFVAELKQRYAGETGTTGPHQMWPHSPSVKWTEKMQDFMVGKVRNLPPEQMIWGNFKEDLHFDEDRTHASFHLQGFRGIYLELSAEIGEILYEDKECLFFRPKSLEMTAIPSLGDGDESG